MIYTRLTFALLVAAGALAAALAWAQTGGRQGGQIAPPPGVDAILAYPLDNSLIVHDPPVDDPDAPPTLRVKAQFLEVFRTGEQNLVRRFRALDSPEVTLTSGRIGEIKVKTPLQTATYPIRVSLDRQGIVTMTLYAANEPDTAIYRLDKKEQVKPGDSVVAKGLIYPLKDGGQRETYLQFTFDLAQKDKNGGDKR
jgi:hypothetical protein